ncbi:NUDIX domain-containing protein [Ditylenchus destructor]|nr:NUDIX domain-containing protein [Ditylenchus destructor]
MKVRYVIQSPFWWASRISARNKSTLTGFLDNYETVRDEFRRRAEERASGQFPNPQRPGIFATSSWKLFQKVRPTNNSAVLVILVNLPTFKDNEYPSHEPWVIFTKRSAKLRAHPGEISFPGGKVENESNIQAALRETHEEIGIQPEEIDVWGELRPTLTRTGNGIITPVVGVLRNPESLSSVKSCDDEVETVIAAPLSELVRSIRFTAFRQPNQIRYELPSFLTQNYRTLPESDADSKNIRQTTPSVRIWGLSGAILHEALSSILPAEISDSIQ